MGKHDLLHIDVAIDEVAINHKLESLIDDKTMLQIHNKFAQMCNEYVPFLEGPLSQSVTPTAECVTYSTPYAHYQYVLHDMAADLAGVTNRTRIYHPKATSFWDKAMMLEKGDLFIAQVENILKARAREIDN